MTKTISLRVDENLIVELKRLAHKLSLERDKDLSWNDLVVETATNLVAKNKEINENS
jgi:tRNA(His) 5'-end guanylyltransferase